MIRAAAKGDLPAITAIYNEAIAQGGFTGDLDPVTEASRHAWLEDHAEPCGVFVKVLDGAVAGYAALSPYRKGRRAFAGTCEISYYVANAYRGAGHGKALVEHALGAARDRGFTTVLAIILACNGRSIGLLRGFGFQEAGRLPKVARLQGAWVDHIYLARVLDGR